MPTELFLATSSENTAFAHYFLQIFAKVRISSELRRFFSSGSYASRVKNIWRRFFAQTSRGTSVSGAPFNLTMGEPVSLTITKLKGVVLVPNTLRFTFLQVCISYVLSVKMTDPVPGLFKFQLELLSCAS